VAGSIHVDSETQTVGRPRIKRSVISPFSFSPLFLFSERFLDRSRSVMSTARARAVDAHDVFFSLSPLYLPKEPGPPPVMSAFSPSPLFLFAWRTYSTWLVDTSLTSEHSRGPRWYGLLFFFFYRVRQHADDRAGGLFFFSPFFPPSSAASPTNPRARNLTS